VLRDLRMSESTLRGWLKDKEKLLFISVSRGPRYNAVRAAVPNYRVITRLQCTIYHTVYGLNAFVGLNWPILCRTHKIYSAGLLQLNFSERRHILNLNLK